MEKKLFREEHSIFYAVAKEIGERTKKIINYQQIYQENLQLFTDYIIYHENLVKEFNKRLDEMEEKVYLFGAHIFSQYLIQFGLNTKKIKYVLDNDVLKQEQRLYGTELWVKSPEILKFEKNPVVILKTASYAEEIKSDILENINSGTSFWE
jgi:hypothetical protein